MRDEKKSLYERIQQVSNEVRNISKGITVGSGNYGYKAVGDLDVTLAVKDAETKYGLVSIPTNQELVNSEILRVVKKNGDEGLTFVDTIKMTVKIINLDNTSEFIEVTSLGKGIDSGDKGFGKASTYARKYALLNAYKIATGEDPDANKSEETKPTPAINEKRKKVLDYLNLDVNRTNEALKHYGVGVVDDLSDANVNQMFNTWTKKNLI